MRTLLRLLAAVALSGAALVAAGAPAGAATYVDAAAAALRSDPVYVDQGATATLDAGAAADLRRMINGGSRAIFIAILPGAATSEAGGSADALAKAIGKATGKVGTYAVVAGKSFRAASSSLPTGRAGELATLAFDAHHSDGVAPTLSDFVRRVQSADAGSGTGSSGAGSSGSGSSGSSGSGSSGSGSSGSGSSSGGLLPLVAVGAGGGGLLYVLRRRKRKASAEALGASRRVVEADARVLGADVVRLEPQITVHPEAAADYQAGVDRYRSVESALPDVRTEAELGGLRRALTEGRYAMARVQAVVDGRQPPPPPDELAAPGPRGEPPVVIDHQGQPTYAGGSGHWGAGWWGGGGLLGGLLLGQVLGGGFGGGYGRGGFGGGFGGGYGDDDDARGGDGGGGLFGGGGDFGGGGGGDFGGGGGGDFGGGGGGGGDF